MSARKINKMSAKEKHLHRMGVMELKREISKLKHLIKDLDAENAGLQVMVSNMADELVIHTKDANECPTPQDKLGEQYCGKNCTEERAATCWIRAHRELARKQLAENV